MTRRTISTFVAVASLVLAGALLAQYQPGSSSGGMTGQSGQTGQMGQTGQTQMRNPDMQQFEQQLRQIAQDPQTAGDKLYILHASMRSQWGSELARQAQQRVQNPQVKQLAQRIVTDEQQANLRIQQLARSLNVQLPQSLPPTDQQVVQILSSLPADQFEKHFVTMMQACSASDLITYRAWAQISQNDQIRQFAQQQLPTLSQHYDQTQQAAVALGLPSGGPEAIPASDRIEGRTSGGADRP